ncbi:MAG: tetratricopeptide repeat protein [Bacteroidota bacterium]
MRILFAGFLMLLCLQKAWATLPTDYEKRLAELKKIPDIQQRMYALNNFAWEVYEEFPQVAADAARTTIQLAQREPHLVEWGDALNVMATVQEIRGDNYSAKDNYQKAISFYQQTGEAEREAAGLGNLANVYQKLGQYQKALDLYQQSYQMLTDLNLAENDGSIHLNLGSLYQKTGDVANAVKHELLALTIYEQNNDRQRLALAYNNLGVTLKEHGLLDSALVYYEKAEQIARANGNSTQISVCNLNIGTVLMKLGKLAEAEEKILLASEMAQSLEFHRLQIHAFRLLGEMALKKGNPERALLMARKSIRMAAESNNEDDITESMLLEANVLSALGRYQQSNAKFEETLQKIRSLGQDLFEKDIYRDIVISYEKQGNFQKAFAYQQLLIQHDQDSILHSSILGQLASGRQIKEKKQEIIDMKKNEDERRKNYQSIIMGVLLIGMLIIGILISHHQHRTNRLLIDQNEAMETKNRRLEQANIELEQFFFAASHDLKGPLRSLGGHISLISKRYRKLLDESGQASMDYALSEVKHVYHLLNDLSAFSEVGKGLGKNAKVDLNQVLDRVKHELRDEIQATGASITHDKLPTIIGHVEHLQPLFQHLIGNGLKFRREGIAPVLQIGYKKTTDCHRIHFSDNGIGIPLPYQHKIFDLFRRLHTREEYEGTGIGLAICHKIVAQMNGRIELDSQEGKGTTFKVFLPV